MDDRSSVGQVGFPREVPRNPFMHVATPPPEAESQNRASHPLGAKDASWRQSLPFKLVWTTALPVGVFALVLWALPLLQGAANRDEQAQARMKQTLGVASDLLEQRARYYRGMLIALLTQDTTVDLVELWNEGELERAAQVSNRIERSCEELMRTDSGVLGIELYSDKGKLFLSVAGGGVAASAFDVQAQDWFVMAESRGRSIACEGEGLARITQRRTGTSGQAELYGTIIVNTQRLIEGVGQIAVAEPEGTRLTLPTTASELVLLDRLATTEDEVLTMSAPTVLGRSSLRLEQSPRSALGATSREGSRAGSSLLLVGLVGTLLVMLWRTVVAPIAAVNAVAEAFKAGTDLPRRRRPRSLPRGITAFLHRRARRRGQDEPRPREANDEIARIDRTLRQAIEIARNSESARIALSQSVDERVAECTSSLVRDKRDAEVANRTRSEFIAQLSASLRAPLGEAIRGTEELLEGELSREQRELARTTHGSTAEVLRALDEVSDFSALETGKIELQAIEFDLHHAIEDAAELLAKRADERSSELSAELLPGVPRRVVGDPVRLCQIVTNLTEHLLDTAQGGDTLIRVSPSHAAATQLLFEVRGTRSTIQPAPGSPSSNSDWDPFAPTTQGSSESGLGLAICRELVQQMNGEISWRCAPGEGTTFWFTVAVAGVSGHQPAVTGLERRRAILIDDNATSRRVISARLKQWAMDVTEAASAKEATSYLQGSGASSFDVALIDESLHESDGVALARSIKDDPRLAHLPLLLLTRADGEAVEAGLFADTLRKPLRQDPLAAALLAAIPETADGPQASSPAPLPQPIPITPIQPLVSGGNAVQPELARAPGSIHNLHPGLPANTAAHRARSLEAPHAAAPRTLRLDPAGPNTSETSVANGRTTRRIPEPPATTLPLANRPGPASRPPAGHPTTAQAPPQPAPTPQPQPAAQTNEVQEPARAQQAPRETFTPDDPSRVLLAHNPGAQADDLAKTLHELGYVLMTTEDANEVLELVDQEPFHALLIDRDLEGIGASRITSQIRARGDLKASVPIIGLTEGSTADERDTCVQMGMDDSVQKAPSVSQIGAPLKRWVSVCSHLSPAEQSRVAQLHAAGETGQ